MLWCVLRMFFTANTICENLGYCVVVEYVCVVCGVSVQALCQCNVCVWVVCLCKSVVVVCVWCCEWVSVCVCSCFVWLCCHLFMCSLVLVFMVCVCLSVVVCHNIVLCCGTQQQTRTHTMNTNATLHMKTPYKRHDSRFQNGTDIRWIKGERTPSIFIYSTTLMWAVMITGRFALQIQVLFSKVCN